MSEKILTLDGEILINDNKIVTADVSGGGGGGANIQSSKSYTVSGSGSTTISPDTGYDAMEAVALTTPAGTATAPASISGTGASVSTGSGTLTLSKTVSNTPNVSTAGYISSGTAGNSSVSLTASVPTQAAQTIHPSTSDQTISSGTYLTGAQTVKGVTISGLTADNIVSGVTVKVGDSIDDDCVVSVTGTASSYIDGDSVEWGTPVYTVTISLTNAQGTGHFGTVRIYKNYTEVISQSLGTITTPNGSTTVQVPSDAIDLGIAFDGSWIGYGPQYATTTCMGDVTHTGGDENYLLFSVTGDGTITVDGVDWEDDY